MKGFRPIVVAALVQAAAVVTSFGGVSVALADESVASPERDPTGEEAFYRVERNSRRTSSIIRDGEMTASVTDYLPDHSDGPSYEVNVDYELSIQIIGTQRGSQAMPVPEIYFTPAFMEDLRVNGSYESSSFKVRHLGYADARNMDGNFYENCDKVLIYDIEDKDASPLIALASSMFRADLENMEITAHIKAGVPVLGAVKLDVTGEYSGRDVKAGADYEAP